MREDANRIAFGAAKAILSAAQGGELQIAGKRATYKVTKLPAPPWPDIDLPGVTAERDAPWPAPTNIDCEWDGGSATLRLTVDHWTRKTYRGLIGLRVLVRPGNRSLVWSTLATVIGDAKDGELISVPGWCNMFKPKEHAGSVQAGLALQRALKEAAKKEKLSLLSDARVQLFQLDLPSGAVLPSPDIAFYRLLQLALLKLDFLDRGARARARGAPLIDISTFVPPGTIPPLDIEDGEDEEVDGEEDDEPSSAARQRLPLNLILYGPPGTGKTYHLLTQLTAPFLRAAGGENRQTTSDSTEAIAALPWWQVVALALADLGGSSDVDGLVGHHWLKAKHAAQGIPTKLGPIVWAQLQQHTVETSTTVHYTRRSGLLLFDRAEDGSWFFAIPLPDELKALRKDLEHGQRHTEQRNYAMVTFHQSYSYEDFIEGIRAGAR